MHRRRIIASAIGLFAACGPATNNVHTGTAPFLASLPVGSTRNIVITRYPGLAQAMESASCTIEADLFDTTTAAQRTTLATDGDCTLYAAMPDLPIASQQWICAGAIIANYGGQAQNLVICPSSGTMLRPISPLDCTGLMGGTTVGISSGNELDGDVVTDLSTQITLPGSVAITQPTSLGVLTWPASGALTVQWTSGSASDGGTVEMSSLVTVTQRATPAGPTIVCRPTSNGTVSISDTLIAQANLRMQDAMLRVFSYNDSTTMAEGTKTYHLWGGTEAAVLLQGLR